MEYPTIIVVMSVVLGFAVGIYAALSGTGGGTLYGPILESFLGLPVALAIGTSLFIVFLNSISTTVAYMRQKRIDYRTSFYLIIFSTPFAVLGSILTVVISNFASGTNIMKLIFYGFVLFSGLFMLFKRNDKPHVCTEAEKASRWYFERRVVDRDGKEFLYNYNFSKVIPWACIAGFLAGFLGIGGGMVMVPVFTVLCAMPMHVVVATSAFMLLFNSVVGATTKLIINSVDLVIGLLFALGSIFGAQLGAKIAKGTTNNTLKDVIAIFLAALAAYKLQDTILFGYLILHNHEMLSLLLFVVNILVDSAIIVIFVARNRARAKKKRASLQAIT
jgi:hypothetical protein